MAAGVESAVLVAARQLAEEARGRRRLPFRVRPPVAAGSVHPEVTGWPEPRFDLRICLVDRPAWR